MSSTYRCPECDERLSRRDAKLAKGRCPTDGTKLVRVDASGLGAPKLKQQPKSAELFEDDEARKRELKRKQAKAKARKEAQSRRRAAAEPEPEPAYDPDAPLEDKDSAEAPPYIPPPAEAIDEPLEALAEHHPHPPARRGGWLTVALLACVGALGGLAAMQFQKLTKLEARLATLEADAPAAAAAAVKHSEEIEALGNHLVEVRRKSLTKDAFAHTYRGVIPDLVKRSETSVVHIINQHWETLPNGRRVRRGGVGSGFFIEDKSYIVTNHHVIRGAQEVRCLLHDHREVVAKVHGSDPASDLALLRVDPQAPGVPEMTSARFADAPLRVGEPVIAIGSPQGLSKSVTLGIVSNTNRYHAWQPMPGDWLATGMFNTWIQTDTAINQGNSGGPMFNLDGEVIAVVTRKLARAGVDNIGFAIPHTYAIDVIEQLKHRRVLRSTIGAFWLPYDPKQAGPPGARVLDVIPGSPAQVAGLRRDDVVHSIGGEPVAAPRPVNLPELESRLAALAIGQPVEFKVKRGAAELKLSVSPRARSTGDDRILSFNQLGFFGRPVSARLASEQGLAVEEGLWICGLQSGGLFLRNRFRRGDVLLSVGHPRLGTKPFTSMAVTWTQLFGALQKKLTPLTFVIQRGRNRVTYTMNLSYGG